MLRDNWYIWVQLPNILLGVLEKNQFEMNINDIHVFFISKQVAKGLALKIVWKLSNLLSNLQR